MTSISNTTVGELRVRLQNFGAWDYVTFLAMLVSCAAIGFFYANWNKKGVPDTAAEYFLGGRNMTVFLISMSLVVR